MSSKKPSLGRGLDALIPKEFDETILSADPNRIQKILITDIKPNPNQPRRQFDEQSILDLADSLKNHGVLQPIIVTKSSSGYFIVAGERRWRAARTAKLEHLPAIVRTMGELEQIELALIENIQRVDLSPLEQAISIYKLQHEFNLSLEEISKKLNKAQSTISNLARLLKLPSEAQQALSARSITEGHARAILVLSGQKLKQDELLRSILNNNLSVREAEKLAVELKTVPYKIKDQQENLIAQQLADKLNTKVKINKNKKGGDLIISYKNSEELKKLTDRLTK